jgi:hypothetical protein
MKLRLAVVLMLLNGCGTPYQIGDGPKLEKQTVFEVEALAVRAILDQLTDAEQFPQSTDPVLINHSCEGGGRIEGTVGTHAG